MSFVVFVRSRKLARAQNNTKPPGVAKNMQWLKRLSGKQLFLLDFLGAVLNIFFLVGILVPFESYFGMPSAVLYRLSLLIVVYALFSFYCYRRTPENWPPFLRGIATANLLYAVLTMVLVRIYFDQLTTLGLLYFALELLVLGAIAYIEFQAAAMGS